MAPSNTHVTTQLRQQIYYHLDHNLLHNAHFLASRLQAYDPRSSEASYLLALCHLKLGQLKAAYDTSRSSATRGVHLGCAYVFAQACLGLERYLEGATALERSKHSETRRQQLPDAAATYCLQGKLWQAHSEHQKSVECFAEALKLNPFMWDAFTALCDLGVHVRVPNIFKVTPEMRSQMNEPTREQSHLPTTDESTSTTNASSQSNFSIHVSNPAALGNDPFTTTSKNKLNGDFKPHAGSSALYEKANNGNNLVTPVAATDAPVDDTPSGNGGIMDPDFYSGKGAAEPPLAPTRKARGLLGVGSEFAADVPPKMRSNATIRSKSRNNFHSDDQEETTLNRATSTATGGADLKRTISGKAAHSQTHSTRPSSLAGTDPGAPQRKSVRLLNQLRPQSGKFSTGASSISLREERELKKAKAPSTKARSANSFNVGRVVSGNRKFGESMDIDSKEPRPTMNTHITSQAALARPVISEKQKETEALQWLLELFHKLGTGYYLLSQYRCPEAIRIFQAVTPSQRDTAWVLAQIGRAHYEQTAYAEAEKVFTRIRTLAPARVEDMEHYSTILWHLKHDVDLAFLSHELIDLDRQSPQAWCAVGNSFSLQRDHDQAIRCFKRATQLDPTFAYAHTLQGHELIQNEEYDKAMSSYRAAITAENRHYNAWYGLGRVFEKQGRWHEAEDHYRTAHSINQTNPILVTKIGEMLEKQKNLQGALVKYGEACRLNEKGSLWKFKRAQILMTLGHFNQALEELKVLKDMTPDEANVHFALGTVYKRLKQKGEAIWHFTMALNLDPRASHHIKETMEEIENDSDDEDM
ncbi:uncharacterized protein KY384_003027 [Bacidia gigantensis]|uniref:uncharacterized protein n=1 Tax=Bacidia gigantensis TaxID=2732470 RepID=UPI001D050CC1|nr:uncharacterized protein KY384_003027 [Bacidia gigantensis]KAG8531398.1 hypothetical protein KY384_003027 [Bacidia gigantensis]